MRVHNMIDMPGIDGVVSRIRDEMDEWRAVNIVVSNTTCSRDILPVAHQVENAFGDSGCGDLFIFGKNEIVTFVKLGKTPDLDHVKNEVASRLKNYKCKVTAGALTEHDLKTVEYRMMSLSKLPPGTTPGHECFNKRQVRKENSYFVVADHEPVRKFLSETLSKHGTVAEFGTASGVVDAYLENLPDIVFTDIHIAGVNGLDLLEKIISYDSTAHVIVQSRKATMENVMKAKNLGAKGFLAKPFKEDKVFDLMARCKTSRLH